MKKILTIAVIAMIGLLTFAGCSKSSSGSSNTMKATIGSTAFSSNNCIFSINAGLLGIYGYTASGATVSYPNISIGINNYTSGSTGTYTISDTSTNIVAGVDSSATSAIVAQTGSIVITSSSSSSISGTFNFTCTDGTKVTGGTFTAKLN